VSIHEQLAEWAKDGTQGLTTLWLSGMAGTGKTAIASTFARRMAEEAILGATFFIDRQQAERRDLSRIIQTLAYELGKHSHAQLRALWAVVQDDPLFDRLPFEKQIRLLIKEPLDIVRPETLVIVIDGLDECGALEGVSLVEALVTSLAHHPIKLLVSSRNEAEIANMFRGLTHSPIELQEIAVSEDVRLYWEHSLDQLCRSKRLPDWRPMVSIDQLVKLTGYLFIYAATILKIIRNTRTSPIKKLRNLLEISSPRSEYTIAFVGPANHGPLEKLYVHILSEALKDDDGVLSDEYVLHVYNILEVVILAQAPLTRQALSDLLDMDIDDLNAYLSPLRSVLVVPDTTSADGVVRPLHQSFPDFVCEQGGLVHPKLIIDAIGAEKHLAERCMAQLNKHLHMNMCHLDDPSLFNDEISDLEIRLRQYLTAALRYSCRFWITHWLAHIRAAGSQAQLPHSLDDFCAEHLLHWIEVTSLTKSLPAVQGGMTELMVDVLVRYLTP
jgi:hypothetical protein